MLGSLMQSLNPLYSRPGLDEAMQQQLLLLLCMWLSTSVLAVV